MGEFALDCWFSSKMYERLTDERAVETAPDARQTCNSGAACKWELFRDLQASFNLAKMYLLLLFLHL